MSEELKIEKPTKKEVAEIKRRLRYMDPENIKKDFKSPEELKAIAAVLTWLGYNGVCAWAQKRSGTYSTTAASRSIRRKLSEPYQAIVIDKGALDKIQRLFKSEE